MSWMNFFRLGMQYYIAGRAAAWGQMMHVAGNLLHHAVEMLLKGQLSKTVPLADLKKFGHRLPNCWDAFKALFPTDDLSCFDQLIVDLDHFEKIRYPDNILLHGAAISLGWGTIKPQRLGGTKVPEYYLFVNEVDTLVARLFKVSSINANFCLQFPHPEAVKWLHHQNAESADWFPWGRQG